MFALVSLAIAVDGSGDEPGFDPAPGVHVPSSAPGIDTIEVRSGPGVQAFSGRLRAGLRLEAQVRLGRFAGGLDVLAQDDGSNLVPRGSGWLGVAVVHRPRLKITPFVRGGRILQGGISIVARTRGGGIGGNDVTFDLSWGPAWATNRLINPSWEGPFDVLGSLPEAGVTLPLHPDASQQLRVGTMGGVPMVSWRFGKPYFVIESSLGVAPYGGVANFTVGSRWGRGQRARSRARR